MLFQQNETVAARRDLFVQMVSSSDHVTPQTGLVLSVSMAKAGGSAYAAAGATSVEIGAGTYRIRLAAADLDTLGAMMLKITAGGADPCCIPVQVVRFLDEMHLAKAALANARQHTIETGVDQIVDDDGSTVLRTLTPSEMNGVISVTPS